MKVSFFIDRPIFSAVISILIVIVGIIGLTMLPIDQYPQIPSRCKNRSIISWCKRTDGLAGSGYPY